MNGAEMVVTIVAIGCATGMFVTTINALRTVLTGRSRREQQALTEEIQSLRTEMLALRSQHNDLLLNVDTTLQRVERRLVSGEARLQTSDFSETRHVVPR